MEGSGSAPTTEPGQRVTATVNHVFGDDRDSPYIVQLEMTGTGEAGLVEGSDTLIATVTRIASIEVFAGESRVVEEGEEVEYGGSFTRPEGLWDIQYRWGLRRRVAHGNWNARIGSDPGRSNTHLRELPPPSLRGYPDRNGAERGRGG